MPAMSSSHGEGVPGSSFSGVGSQECDPAGLQTAWAAGSESSVAAEAGDAESPSVGRPLTDKVGRPLKLPKMNTEQHNDMVGDMLHPSLVSAVHAVCSGKASGDMLWQAWVEEFGQGVSDPNKYDKDFLLSFIDHVQSVECTQEPADGIQQDGVRDNVLEGPVALQPLAPAPVPAHVHISAGLLCEQIRKLYRSVGTKTEQEVEALLVRYRHALPELMEAAMEMQLSKASTELAASRADMDIDLAASSVVIDAMAADPGEPSRDAAWDASETLVRRTAGPNCEGGPIEGKSGKTRCQVEGVRVTECRSPGSVLV